MGDLAFLEDYIAETPEAVEGAEEKSNFLDSPLKNNDSPLTIVPGEKFEESKEKKQDKKAPSAKQALNTLVDHKKRSDKVIGALGADELPTPPTGGIGLLVFMALLVVFAITKAPGQDVTRLTLLWQSIMGNYTYSSGKGSGGGGGKQAPTGGKNYMPGSGNFGTGSIKNSPSSSPNNLGSLIQGGYTY